MRKSQHAQNEDDAGDRSVQRAGAPRLCGFRWQFPPPSRTGGGDGFAHGADQAEVDEVLGDLDPVTLKYQPSEFPAFNALMAYSRLGPPSPNADELATGAMMAELAWSNEDVQSEVEGKGLTVLPSMIIDGEYYIMCNPKNAGVELDDWHGRSIRAGSTMNELVVKAAGATPVSMEYGETFEGLQRNILGCAFIQFAAASNLSVPEVAPNISYLTEGSFAGRASNIVLAGPSFNDLPFRLPADHLRCGVTQENGVEDRGGLDDINDWYERDSIDFLPFAEVLYEDVVVPHRPE